MAEERPMTARERLIFALTKVKRIRLELDAAIIGLKIAYDDMQQKGYSAEETDSIMDLNAVIKALEERSGDNG